MDEPTKSKKPLVIGIILLLVFAVAYAFVLFTFKSEGENRAAGLAPNEKIGEDRIDTYARIVTADPVKGDISVRLTFTPHGSLLSADGVTLSRDLVLDVSSATGKHAYEFKKGKRMDPAEVIVEIYEGEPMEYPFDHHEAQLSFYFEPAGGGADADKGIPVAVQLYGSVSGLKIEAEYAKEHTDDHVVVDLSVSRAPTAIFFSVFIMVAMWSLTLGVIFLVFRVLAGHRKIEISMFSFLGALLFAFPALRNSQPGTPPIGTLSDFLAFFWAEVLIALSLLAVVLTWLIRGPGGDNQK
ncbi:MAG: hypothetical protein DMF06_07990 [Verrucomicrobia bacterium]|nr:MAG: hypothetical protein DMF06_07990 [Verrucomicrobiota bacterium]